MMQRRAGILVHPSSLPGPWGAGDLGPVAHRFLDWLAEGKQRIWQVLPVQPPDGFGSPYASPSAMARDPNLISLEWLLRDGWLQAHELPERRHALGDKAVTDQRAAALWTAAGRVAAAGVVRGADWVADWSLFRALQWEHGPAWTRWPEALRDRQPDAMAAAREAQADAIARHAAIQWIFGVQWRELADAAHARGIDLWGDLPFFVGAEACDVWAHRELFRLDPLGRPRVVTGVPPDAFSPTGQRWGHAHYDEDAHRAQGYAWWRARVRAIFELFDAARIDHFRGVEGVWEIPVEAPDATSGRWVPGPGAPLLQALRDDLGDLPLIAEDLGVITPQVEALRDDFGLPGMAILQFAFGGDATNPYLPHNHRQAMVAYPGTHDNDTTVGWYDKLDDRVRHHVRMLVGSDGHAIAWDLLRVVYGSVANTAIVPLQDVLELPSSCRTNTPGLIEGNWQWRAEDGALTSARAQALATQVVLFGR